jgi:hypothetical protein
LKGKFVSDISFHSVNFVRGRIKTREYKVFQPFIEK